ncbi:hypothetical protein GBA52_004918 [Prunus armeniaca]|nr:hypothetical protein GBA52_004918 [Prunus armeniaca]
MLKLKWVVHRQISFTDQMKIESENIGSVWYNGGHENFVIKLRFTKRYLQVIRAQHCIRAYKDETSVLRSKLLEHENLVRYVDRLKTEFVDAGSSSSVPNYPSSAAPRRGPSNWSSKPKSKPKREKTKEEKSFKRRSKYFLVAQLVSVVLFVTLMARADDAEIELDDDEGYE